MKIGCHCGELIIDQTDDLPHKGHLIPDQEWLAVWDAIDDKIIDPLAAGQIEKEAAYRLTRHILGRAARLMYQCRSCGRLYIDDLEGNLHCYAPASEDVSHEILRNRESRA
jgi:hypothetical protein